MKKKIFSLALALLLCVGLEGCSCKHEWLDATCAKPVTCAKCGETSGAPLGHTWRDATCAEPMTCTVCGETSGTHLEHQWQEATCTEPETCINCGETQGEAPGHGELDKTGVCSVCGEAVGIPLTAENYTEYFTITGHERLYAKKEYTGNYAGKYCPYTEIWFTATVKPGYTYHDAYVIMKATPSNSKYWGTGVVSGSFSEDGVLNNGNPYDLKEGESWRQSYNSYNTARNTTIYYQSEAAAKKVGTPNFSWSLHEVGGYVVPDA